MLCLQVLSVCGILCSHGVPDVSWRSSPQEHRAPSFFLRSPDGGDIGSTDADVMRMGIVIALHIASVAQMGAVPELMDSCFLVLDGTRLLRIFPSASPCTTIHLLSQFGSAVMYRKSGSLNRSPISLFQDTQGAQFATSSYTPITCAVCIQHNSRKSPKKGCKIPYKWAQLFRKILLDKTGRI